MKPLMLTGASYLQKAGLDVCVLERRHLIGGAAVTEEIVPGYKFSRASYVLSLLRPQIVSDLDLKKYGLKVYLRDPNAYTPLIEPVRVKGQERYTEFEALLDRIVTSLDPMLDSAPVDVSSPWKHRSLREKYATLTKAKQLYNCARQLGRDSLAFYELMTAPAVKVLDKWFESEPLKATLATDAVIGAMMSPESPGSGYVLLHHVMGELEGVKGAWGYVEGGMGAVSNAIADCALDHGASVFTKKPVKEIITRNNEACGVVLDDGTEIKAKVVLSNATPKVTFLDLLTENVLPEEMRKDLELVSFESPVTKINADPNTGPDSVMPHHRCTIHLNCEDTADITQAYLAAKAGEYSSRPMIEMTVPSSLDPTLAPPGHHVVLLFTQYTPYTLAGGKAWDEDEKNKYADMVFGCIEQYAPGFQESVVGRDILTPPDLEQIFGLTGGYAPGFQESVVGRDILTPPDLERIFGLTGGNIFHGSMSLDQLYMSRPVPSMCNYRLPVRGLYLCGSGAHPESNPNIR
ncbi:PYRD2-like protein [Mya arenaria]|uniref:Pyridine nucleotide-disulfide oxidoreductase domain-containing protein 2 n=1 Tax=Mya arenaria TaxID=6604 RepID=A0ABY7FJA3_MYAAR|nr:PYRD2-like protein [Mya arenaria]